MERLVDSNPKQSQKAHLLDDDEIELDELTVAEVERIEAQREEKK